MVCNRTAVSGDGRFVLAASNHELLLWELPIGRGHTRSAGMSGGFRTFRLERMGIGPCQQTAKLHLCHLCESRTLAAWQHSPSGIADLALSPYGRWAAAASGLPRASSDDTLRLWECQTGQVLARFIGDCRSCCCCFYDDAHCIMVGYRCKVRWNSAGPEVAP